MASSSSETTIPVPSSPPITVVDGNPPPYDAYPNAQPPPAGGWGGYSQYYPAPPQAIPSTTEMRISARATGIPKMDGLLGKADPYLVVTVGEGEARRLVFKSEVIRNNLNPVWKPFTIDLHETGGDQTPLLWQAFDWDEDGGHDFIGAFTATLAQVNQQRKFIFMNPERRSTFGKRKPESGEFTITSCETVQVPAKPLPSSIRFVFRGEKLSKKDLFSSDPFLVLYSRPYPAASGLPPHVAYWHDNMRRQLNGGAAAEPPLVIISKTEVVKKSVNPTWNALELPLELTGGLHARFVIVCYDYNDDGTHEEIGRATVSLKTLTSPDPLIPLINPQRQGDAKGFGKYLNSGLLRVSSFTELYDPPSYKPPAFDFSVSMKKLARMDFGGLGKCDPFIQIAAQVIGQPDPHAPPVVRDVVVFKSEILYKTLSPTFKPFQLTVLDCGGMDNQLLFQVFDKDPKGQEVVGDFKTTLRELSLAQYNTFFLQNPKHFSAHSGIVTITSCTPTFTVAHQAAAEAPAFRLFCAAKHLDSAHAHVAFSVHLNKGGPLVLHSNTVQNSKNPVFEPVIIEVQACGGLDAPLYFEFSDYADPTRTRLLGGFNVSLRELTLAQVSPPPIPIIDPKKSGGLGYKSSGDFQVTLAEPLYRQQPDPSQYYPPQPAGGSYYPQPAAPYYPPADGTAHYPPSSSTETSSSAPLPTISSSS